MVMKVQENLFFDPDLNYATLQKVASHILVFLVRSVINPIKIFFGKFCYQ